MEQTQELVEHRRFFSSSVKMQEREGTKVDKFCGIVAPFGNPAGMAPEWRCSPEALRPRLSGGLPFS